MARVNVYLPDDLAARARARGLNVSAVTRAALEAELAQDAGSAWLRRTRGLLAVPVAHADVLDAIAAARDELGAA